MLREDVRERTDLVGRRLVGPYLPLTPVLVFDKAGAQIGKFKSPRKLGRAITSGAIVLIAGDRIVIGRAS
jgi:hypothetical protein